MIMRKIRINQHQQNIFFGRKLRGLHWVNTCCVPTATATEHTLKLQSQCTRIEKRKQKIRSAQEPRTEGPVSSKLQQNEEKVLLSAFVHRIGTSQYSKN